MNRLANPLWLLLGLALIGLGPTAHGYPEPLSGTAINSFPGSEYTSVANEKLRIDVRNPGIVQTINPGTGTTAPSIVGYSNYRGGRAVISTVMGDPYTTVDDDLVITDGASYSTWAGVEVTDLPTAATPDPDPRYYEAESTMQPVNNPNQDIFTQYPQAVGDEVRFGWQIREGYPTLTTVLADNVTNANAGLAGNTTPSQVLVSQTYRLVDDKVRVEVLVQNVSTLTLNVGGHVYIAPNLGPQAGATDTYHVDGILDPVDHEALYPDPSGTGLRTLPRSYRVFDNEASPGVVLGGIWDGGDVRTAALTAGPPTQAMLVDRNLVSGSWFTYTPLAGGFIGAKMGVLMRWAPALLAPNQARRYITYFGLGGADGNYDPPYALTVQAPFSLGLSTGDDPTTPTTEAADHSYRTPNPFAVRATVYNSSDRSLSGIALALALPPGLSLAVSGDSLSKTMPLVPPRTAQTVTWQVRANSAVAPGAREFSVSSSGAGIVSKVIDRSIGIPALPQLEFPSLARRLDMISIPYDFANRDIQHVLGALGTIGVTGGGNAAVARYNPAARAYAFFPESFLTSIYPGESYWLFNGSLNTLTLPADRQVLSPNQNVAGTLNTGWNQIGCPFTTPVRLFDCFVVGADGVSRRFLDAVGAGQIRPVIYEYIPNDLNPTAQGTYSFAGDEQTYLNPWRGYWIRAVEPVTMLFVASSQLGPYARGGRGPLELGDGWEFPLTADSAVLGKRPVWLGLDSLAADGYDSRDVEAPPTLRAEGDLRLSVVRADWGREAGAYMRDIQSGVRQRSVWRVAADCDRPNEDITLRWNLRTVPADVQLTLVDLETGAQRHLRTTSAFTFNTGANPRTRMFEVVATRGGGGGVSIPFMAATETRGRGVSIGFALTAPASVDVVIESPTGRRIKVAANGMAAVAGQNTVAWDGLDEAGRPVPAGLYRCRVLVATDDGQRAIAERLVRLGR